MERGRVIHAVCCVAIMSLPPSNSLKARLLLEEECAAIASKLDEESEARRTSERSCEVMMTLHRQQATLPTTRPSHTFSLCLYPAPRPLSMPANTTTTPISQHHHTIPPSPPTSPPPLPQQQPPPPPTNVPPSNPSSIWGSRDFGESVSHSFTGRIHFLALLNGIYSPPLLPGVLISHLLFMKHVLLSNAGSGFLSLYLL